MEKENTRHIYNYCYDDQFEEEDLNGRRLYLNGEVDESVIDSIVYHIMRFNRMDAGIPVEERKPIRLYINSPGGSVVDGYGVIDAIQSSETPVYTINLALCASMGFLIYLAGAKRYAMPHSEFLMHDGSTMGYDSAAKMRDRIEFETVELEGETRKYILSRTKIDDELYTAKYRCEWYFLPVMAKELGVVDYIIGTDCALSEIV